MREHARLKVGEYGRKTVFSIYKNLCKLSSFGSCGMSQPVVHRTHQLENIFCLLLLFFST